MKQRKFTILNQSSEKLVCVEVLPDSSSASLLPAVILCHGFSYFKEESGLFTGLAERLAGQGYAIYYFDFSGCGESDGDYAETSLTKLVADLNVVYNEVTSYAYVNPKTISLVGQSFGTCVIIASQINGLDRMVLCGSLANAKSLLAANMTEFNEFGISYKTQSSGRITKINPGFWSDLKLYDFGELIKTFDCPILFIHAQLDKTVPIENMRQLYALAKHAVAPFILPNSDHGLMPERQQVFDAVAEFFDKQVLKSYNLANDATSAS